MLRKLTIGLEACHFLIISFSKHLQQQCLFHSAFIWIEKRCFVLLLAIKIENSDYVYWPERLWARVTKVTTGDCELQVVTTGDNKSDYKWLWVTIIFGWQTCHHTWLEDVFLKISTLHYLWLITEGVCLKVVRKIAEIWCSLLKD